MKRLVMMAILNMLGKALLFTLVASIIIDILGKVNQWDTSLEYGNAFFIAGSLMIIAGTASRLGQDQDWQKFRGAYAESFREMSPSERANYIVKISSSVQTLILGILSGLML